MMTETISLPESQAAESPHLPRLCVDKILAKVDQRSAEG